MATVVQFRGGNTADTNAFTGAAKELTVDTTKNVVVVHDGTNAGGSPMMRADGTHSALNNGNATDPALKFSSGQTGIYSPGANKIALSTGGTGKLFIDGSGRVGIGAENVDGQLEVRNTEGVISRSPSTQATNTNKAYRGRNNSATDTFSVSYKGQGYFSDSLGIGTPDPEGNLEIKVGDSPDKEIIAGYTTGSPMFTYRNGAGAWFHAGKHPSDNAFVITSGSSTTAFEHLRIDQFGRVMFGTSAPGTGAFGTIPAFHSASNGTTNVFQNFGATTFPARIDLCKTRGTSANSHTVLQDDDTVGGIFFAGSDGTDYAQAAQIEAFVDGTPGNNDLPGRLVFSTTPSGAGNALARMTIKNDGTINFPVTNIQNFADDSYAAAGGLAVGDVYRTGSVLKIRVS